MTQAAVHSAFATKIASLYTSRVPTTCSVKRNSQPDDSEGGWSDSTTNATTGVPCRFRPATHDEIIVADAPEGYGVGAVYMPAKFNGAALDIKVKDALDIAAWGIEPARTVQIVAIPNYEGVQIEALVIFKQA